MLHAFVPADLFGREAAAGARLLSAFLARIFSPLATTLFRHPCLLPTSLLAYFSSVYSCNCVYVCVSLYLHNCLCTAVHPTSRSCFSSAPHLPQHALVYFVSLPSSHLPAAGLVDVSFLMLTSSLTTHYVSLWKMCLSENFQTFLSFLANPTYLYCATVRNVPRLLEFWCFWHLSLLSVPTSAALSLLEGALARARRRNGP